MVIYLPGDQREPQTAPEPSFDELTPREIVVELDKYIVGQNAAKRAVAVALRNRVRRQKLPPELAEDVLPKNILMIGPTGVGKTEIARRLARLAGCPFVKVEASKYTEVGYVGRDVESMVRDLVETSIDMVREEKLDEVAELNGGLALRKFHRLDRRKGRDRAGLRRNPRIVAASRQHRQGRAHGARAVDQHHCSLIRHRQAVLRLKAGPEVEHLLAG